MNEETVARVNSETDRLLRERIEGWDDALAGRVAVYIRERDNKYDMSQIDTSSAESVYYAVKGLYDDMLADESSD